jgi:phytoene dehydrogenase-like protein
MAQVVVVGAGLGGMSVAARLAKLGHAVMICERDTHPGGSLRAIEKSGFRWDAGPASTTLPAALRDLFRKSGRPRERYIQLQLRAPARRHVFEDGTVVDLPTGSRSQQVEAVTAGLGAGSGQRWAHFVDGQAMVWQTLRREVLDRPDGGARLGDRRVARTLNSRTSLGRLLRKSLPDERLQAMASHPFVLAGSALTDVPAFGAVEPYVERSFGVWSIPSGMAAVTDALVTRLNERGVTMRYDAAVSEVLVRDDRVVGVETESGERIRADVVITDVDPRRVVIGMLAGKAPRAARRTFASAEPAIPPAVSHLGLSGDVPALPEEVVLHGDPLLVLTTAGSAPAGHAAWTVWRRGSAHEDVLVTLARRGIDVSKRVVARVERSPLDVMAQTGGSPSGFLWAGWRAHAARAALSSPVQGLHMLGAGMHPGASIPYVVWGAAHVAARIGKP